MLKAELPFMSESLNKEKRFGIILDLADECRDYRLTKNSFKSWRNMFFFVTKGKKCFCFVRIMISSTISIVDEQLFDFKIMERKVIRRSSY